MAIEPTGYKLYWATSLEELYIPHNHPNAALNNDFASPIVLSGVSNILLPGVDPITLLGDAFWDASMEKIYISIAAFYTTEDETIDGPTSKPVLISSAATSLSPGGYRMFSVPLKSGGANDMTVSALKSMLNNRASQMLRANHLGQIIPITTDNAFEVPPHEGLVIVVTSTVNTQWRGRVWQNV